MTDSPRRYSTASGGSQGGNGNLMTILPIWLASTSAPLSSSTRTSYPGTACARAGLYGETPQCQYSRTYGPTGFRLPPVVDYRNIELSLRPDQRVRIASLTGKKERPETAQIISCGYNCHQGSSRLMARRQLVP